MAALQVTTVEKNFNLRTGIDHDHGPKPPSAYRQCDVIYCSFTLAIDHRARAGAALELEVGMEQAGWLQQRRGCMPTIRQSVDERYRSIN